LVCGRLFDLKGIVVLIAAAGVAALFAPLVFFGGLPVALLGLGLWGAGMGAQESILRAGIASMFSKEKRATAYGMFHTSFGICWFLGSALMGFLYDRSITALVVFSVLVQLASLPLFHTVSQQVHTDERGTK